MPRRVFVGNLTSSFTSQDLVAHFSRAGEVRAAPVVSDSLRDNAGNSALSKWRSLPTLSSHSAC